MKFSGGKALTSQPNRPARVEGANRRVGGAPAPAPQQPLPGLGHVGSQGRDHAQAGHDHSPFQDRYFPIFSWRYLRASPTVRSFSASSSGMSTSNSFSQAITSSTVSRLSAPRSSMKLASLVSFSRSPPSSFSMMSLTLSELSAI